jgi:uncharacterized metal-binding protein
MTLRSVLIFYASLPLGLAAAPAFASAPSCGPNQLTYIAGSTVKVEQVIGDCDWQSVDFATGAGTCRPTTSRTVTNADVLGNDIGYSFTDGNRLIFLFGDTIGTKTAYRAHDVMASSTSADPASGLLLDFFKAGDGSTLLVEPKFADGSPLAMGADDVPNSGISLDGQIYIFCNTGSDTSLPNPHAHDSSVLVRFDEATKSFSAGRTVSSLPGGHFIITSPRVFGSDVLMFGLGDYRATDVYLAEVPRSSFESGAGTRYFAGLSHGQPTWTTAEADAVPVVTDNPLNGPAWPNDSPTIGNLSVVYAADVGLWLMTYDGGRQSEATNGVYFTSAPAPWGPWSTPQLIFNAKRDHGQGVFIHDPGQVPDDLLDGPTIAPANNPPATTRGGNYAPLMIERFTRVSGNTLTIEYAMSTWNPYTVVRMRSAFQIARADQTLCIDDQPGDQRFRLQVAFQTSQGGGQSGSGHGISLSPVGVTRGGAFWFFSPDNPEMLAKLLDGCGTNGQRWFFASAGTNVGFTATVTDSLTGKQRTYSNPDLTAAAPIADTSFEACAGSPVASSAEANAMAAVGPMSRPWFLWPNAAASGGAPCAPGPTTLCIDGTVPDDRRFQVEVSYQTSQGGGHAGQGQAVPLSSVGITHGGGFWFFSADNPEMLVKVIDGCAANSRKWFFASAGTNVGYAVTLTDTTTGVQKTYTNPDLTTARPIQDTSALGTCL